MKKQCLKRRIFYLMIVVMVLAVSTACDSKKGSDSGDKVYELKFTGQDAEGLPATVAMYKIASEVEMRTGGKVKIKVYPSNQLGEAKLQYEGIMDGSIDMLLGYLGPTYNKIFDVTAIPFLASNYDEIAYICSNKSNSYKLFAEAAEATDMKFMGFFLNGVNGLFSTKPLGDYLNPNVRKDAMIRIPNSVIYQIGVEAMGYRTITIPWPDTYTSLQTGIMDGMTGIPSYMVDQNFGDITKYYLSLDMFIETNSILMSPKTAEKLPDEYVRIIQEVCNEVSAESLVVTESNVNEGIESLRAKKIEIYPITGAERDALAVKIREKIAPQLADYFGADVLKLVQQDIETAGK
jgi:TRAP-type C4-dicarboxylate transport system substrate-binding protein